MQMTTLSSTLHGCGTPLFTNHPNLPIMASVGPSKVIHISSTIQNAGLAVTLAGEKSSANDTLDPSDIIDDSSNLLDQIIPPSPSSITYLTWSPDGSTLGALQQGSPILVLWNRETKRMTNIDVYVKNLVFIAFSDVSSNEIIAPLLVAIGTGKGNVLVFDVITGKRISELKWPPSASASLPKQHPNNQQANKFSKVLCGDWSARENGDITFALEDGTIIVGNNKGKVKHVILINKKSTEATSAATSTSTSTSTSVSCGMTTTVITCAKNATLTSLKYAPVPHSSTFGANLGNSFLLCRNCSTQLLLFKPEYGRLVAWQWLMDGTIIAGFATGYVCNVSVQNGAKELTTIKADTLLNDISYVNTPTLQLLAVSTIKNIMIVDFNKNYYVKTIQLHHRTTKSNKVGKIKFAASGILCVSTKSGHIIFLSLNERKMETKSAWLVFAETTCVEFDVLVSGGVLGVACFCVLGALVAVWDVLVEV